MKKFIILPYLCFSLMSASAQSSSDISRPFNRQHFGPLETNSVFSSKAEADVYAKGLIDDSTTAYAGQTVSWKYGAVYQSTDVIKPDGDLYQSGVIQEDGTIHENERYYPDLQYRYTEYDEQGTPQGFTTVSGFRLSRNKPRADAIMEVYRYDKTKKHANGYEYASRIWIDEYFLRLNLQAITPWSVHSLRIDTLYVQHVNSLNEKWNFRSSLRDTSFYIRKHLRFSSDEQNNYQMGQPDDYPSICVKNGGLHLSDRSGGYSLSQLAGKIYTQTEEPDIPTNSFAFWVNDSVFYLILDSEGTQKKTQLQ